MGIGDDHKCGDWRQDLDEYREDEQSPKKSLLHRVKAEVFAATSMAEMKGKGGDVDGLNTSCFVLSSRRSSPKCRFTKKAGASLRQSRHQVDTSCCCKASSAYHKHGASNLFLSLHQLLSRHPSENIVRHLYRLEIIYSLSTLGISIILDNDKPFVIHCSARTHAFYHETHPHETPNLHLDEQDCEDTSFAIIQTKAEYHDSQKSPSYTILEGHRRKSSTPALRRSTNTATEARRKAKPNRHITGEDQDSQTKTSSTII